MSILSPEDPFAERIVFWVLLLEKIKNSVALPKGQMGLVFWVAIVGDRLRSQNSILLLKHLDKFYGKEIP
jgi:hypothetical protein